MYRAAIIARIFGTNDSVISLIWVTAMKIEMITPTTRPTPISGADTINAIRSVSCPTATTVSTSKSTRSLQKPSPRYENTGNERISASVRIFQPSTRMNKSSLNGNEMVIGGSVIMPIDIRIDATIMSIVINGR